MITASVLAACGGGGASTDTAAKEVSGAASSVTSSETGGTTPGAPVADVTAPPNIDTALSSTQLAEALLSAQDIKANAAALLAVGSSYTTADLQSTTVYLPTDSSSDVTVADASDSNAVGTLAVATAPAKYVKVSDEGHTFTVPAKTVVRYGDPASNRWVSKTLSGNAECSNRYFGADPAFLVVKACQAYLTTAAAITIAPAAPVVTQAISLMPFVDVTKIPTPAIGYSTMLVQPTTEVAPVGSGGAFRTGCGVAKFAFDDPIVYPGQPGKSHLHTFFGNVGVNANSTAESLRTTGNSTCRGGIANRSSYWVASLIDTRTGAPVVPEGNSVYYKSGFVGNTPIHTIPAGLRMIAGVPSATSPPNSPGVRFHCSGGPNDENDKYGAEIPDCDAGAAVVQEIVFPQCWDGVNLDSPDHKSHMAYPDNNACPASHPVAIPVISYGIGYVVPKKGDSAYWRVSSDNYDKKQPGGWSSHGDWFNGWKSDISDSWGKNCVAAGKDCHSHLTGDGRMMYDGQ